MKYIHNRHYNNEKLQCKNCLSFRPTLKWHIKRIQRNINEKSMTNELVLEFLKKEMRLILKSETSQKLILLIELHEYQQQEVRYSRVYFYHSLTYLGIKSMPLAMSSAIELHPSSWGFERETQL